MTNRETLLHHNNKRAAIVCTSYTNATMTSSDPPIVENVDEDDEPIDEEQLEEYREMVENLGNNPVSIPFMLPVVSSNPRDKPTR